MEQPVTQTANNLEIVYFIRSWLAKVTAAS